MHGNTVAQIDNFGFPQFFAHENIVWLFLSNLSPANRIKEAQEKVAWDRCWSVSDLGFSKEKLIISQDSLVHSHCVGSDWDGVNFPHISTHSAVLSDVFCAGS